MLGKLIKHEFRATGRRMLPVLGVLALLGVLANLSMRLLEADVGGTLVRIFMLLFIVAFFIGIIVAWVLVLVMMITRFYRNLLKDEGYLMFTLPTDAHALIWSKLIVSTVWFFALSLLSVLFFGLTMLNVIDLSGTELRGFFGDLGEMMAALKGLGVTRGSLVLLGVELMAASILSCLASCLHFYAAMGLGQMSSTHKGLFSVLAFIGINIVFQTVISLFASGLQQSGSFELIIHNVEELAESAPGMLKAVNTGVGSAMLLELLQGAVLYVVTALTLKKKLNLA